MYLNQLQENSLKKLLEPQNITHLTKQEIDDIIQYFELKNKGLPIDDSLYQSLINILCKYFPTLPIQRNGQKPKTESNTNTHGR
jgi:hypothetical protein